MTLYEIKNEVAKELIGEGWFYLYNSRLFDNQEKVGKAIDEIAKRYATTCVKASLERAAEMADGYVDENVRGDQFVTIIKSSINSPDNIVLL